MTTTRVEPITVIGACGPVDGHDHCGAEMTAIVFADALGAPDPQCRCLTGDRMLTLLGLYCTFEGNVPAGTCTWIED